MTTSTRSTTSPSGTVTTSARPDALSILQDVAKSLHEERQGAFERARRGDLTIDEQRELLRGEAVFVIAANPTLSLELMEEEINSGDVGRRATIARLARLPERLQRELYVDSGLDAQLASNRNLVPSLQLALACSQDKATLAALVMNPFLELTPEFPVFFLELRHLGRRFMDEHLENLDQAAVAALRPNFTGTLDELIEIVTAFAAE